MKTDDVFAAIELGHHWYRQWLGAYPLPRHYLLWWWLIGNQALRNDLKQNTKFSLKKVHLKMSSAIYRLFYQGHISPTISHCKPNMMQNSFGVVLAWHCRVKYGYRISHVPRQHGCRAMCKISKRILHDNTDESRINFYQISSTIKIWNGAHFRAAMCYFKCESCFYVGPVLGKHSASWCSAINDIRLSEDTMFRTFSNDCTEWKAIPSSYLNHDTPVEKTYICHTRAKWTYPEKQLFHAICLPQTCWKFRQSALWRELIESVAIVLCLIALKQILIHV